MRVLSRLRSGTPQNLRFCGVYFSNAAFSTLEEKMRTREFYMPTCHRHHKALKWGFHKGQSPFGSELRVSPKSGELRELKGLF